MNKLKIAAFKAARLPEMAELNVTGGITCEGVHVVARILEVTNPAQFYQICDMPQQCTENGQTTTTTVPCNEQ
jgi:hypothetical protein